MKRKFLSGVRSFVFGLGLFGVFGFGFSLNVQAAAITIDAITITTPTTAQNPIFATIYFSTPNAGFGLTQDPDINFISLDPSTNLDQIQINLYFAPPGQAPEPGVLSTDIVTNDSGNYSITTELGTLLAEDYHITATSYFQNSTDSMTISSVPIPAAIWLFVSGIVPLLMIGRRKLRG